MSEARNAALRLIVNLLAVVGGITFVGVVGMTLMHTSMTSC